MSSTLQFRSALIGVAAFATVAGLSFGSARGAADPELAMLLRFMAVMKAAMALAALALMAWRLGSPMKPGLAAAGIAAVALMAVASGLIWSLDHVALGAVLFHVGLFAALYVAWRDDGKVSLPARTVRFRTSAAAAFLRGSARGRT